jgi:quercetin dioxygenase-like cupin family protein
VTFEPGCRNSWHKHAGGQILLVTGGRGYFQEWGKPARELHAGDVVTIPADVKHWHGAAKDSWFVHLAVEVNSEKGPATWLEPVSDEDYKKLK